MRRVLIVVDDHELRMSLAGRLRRAQLDVTTACNELEAVNAIGAAPFLRRRQGFDLVITDAPDGHGPGLAAALGRSRRAVSTLPIAGLRAQPEAVARGVVLEDVVELAKTIARYGRLGRA